MTFLGQELSRPSYVPVTSWLRHGPFAMWLVRAVKPATIVELGTRDGFSYFAFCQAVKDAGLPTRCIAVSTWQGTEHPDPKDQEVFEAVTQENEQYAGFSTLLHMSFSEALAKVDDSSIDILHIQGKWLYENVQQNIENWLPKLADRSVILVHGIEDSSAELDIWRCWERFASDQPTFKFCYDHGLGVIFRGGDLTPEMTLFRQASENTAGRDALQAVFQAEGDALVGDYTQTVLVAKAAEGSDALSDAIAVLGRREVVTSSPVRLLENPEQAVAISLSTALSQLTDALARSEDVLARTDELTKTVSRYQTDNLDMQAENQVLRGELAQARSSAIKVWTDYVLHRFLRSLASSRLPIPERVRGRIARSARKRDPKRSLVTPGQPDQTDDLPVSVSNAKIMPGRRKQNPAFKNVLLVSHEMSRTGAPILVQNVARELSARYNIFVVSIRGGDLVDAILDVSVEVVVSGRYPQRGNSSWRFLKRFLSGKDLDFAVVNSVESRHVLPLLHELGVTSVSLIHEFASYTRPQTAFTDVMTYADEVVFSSPLTLENAAEAAGVEISPKVHVFPQGKCIIPGGTQLQMADKVERQRLKAHLRPAGHENDFLVIGAGHVQIRKGVDLFIEVARHAMANTTGRPLRFVWIGSGYDPEYDSDYSVYLQDQLKRSGLVDDLLILPPTNEIEYAYEQADALLLPSRLDPLPNVAIDAMLTGLPVLCFENATGISAVLKQGNLETTCVAEYLNTANMVEKLEALVASPDLYADVAHRAQAHAQEIFEMSAYVARIENLALASNARKLNRASDVEIIAAEPKFRQEYVLSPGSKVISKNQLAEQYLTDISKRALPRRPEPGFNPHLYAYHMLTGKDQALSADPYADFLKRGRPAGPWSLPVICENSAIAVDEPTLLPRCALQIHAYYVDMLTPLLAHIRVNTTRPALFVSVVDEKAQTEAKLILSDYEGDWSIRIIPNAGRDIGPLLTGFGADLIANYDVVGHVHTKKSVALSDDDLVENWTRFLLENVLGGTIGGAMLDRVLTAFAENDQLGVVFPSDPHLMAWTRNRDQAQRLADRLGLGNLPVAFDFPLGTMFWMRADALRPFVDLRLGWSDYPREPIAGDGTMLHALERLFGIVPVLNGYKAAVTCVAGLTR